MQRSQILRHLLVLQIEVAVLLFELLVGKRYFVIWVIFNANGPFIVGWFLVFFGVGRWWYFIGKGELICLCVTLSLIFYLL